MIAVAVRGQFDNTDARGSHPGKMVLKVRDTVAVTWESGAQGVGEQVTPADAVVILAAASTALILLRAGA
jgi:hypothetical protein